MSHKHLIRLEGAAAGAEHVSGSLFRDLLDVLLEGAERALRYRLEGRSTAQGPVPRWLRPASDFALVRDPALPSSAARIEARTLRESLPDRFPPGAEFADLDPEKSAVDLFEDALEDALSGDEDSDRFDDGLVQTFEKFGRLLNQGVDGVELVNGRTLRVNGASLERVRTLAARSYGPQKVRVVGRLDTIRYSDCRFSLALVDGQTLAGTALAPGREVLQDLFGRDVIVYGTAVFRPSGRPLRIDADAVEPATERDARMWSSLPQPLLPRLNLRREVRGPQDEKSGFAALLRSWPGSETDEEVAKALEELS